jgi:hypothetical protein
MQLSEVIPWGRSFKEYREMFALSRQDLGKIILGCADGPASFNTELTKKGGRVISADPLYKFSTAQIEQRIKKVYPLIMEQMTKDAAHYIWTAVTDPEDLGKRRLAAMDLFLDDFQTGKKEGRYIDAAMPELPFADKSFDLALCSHYLFLYSEQTTLAHHIRAVTELCRVAREVRIYPLVTLKNEPSPYISPVACSLLNKRHEFKTVPVKYQFQKGATEMLVIHHQSPA